MGLEQYFWGEISGTTFSAFSTKSYLVVWRWSICVSFIHQINHQLIDHLRRHNTTIYANTSSTKNTEFHGKPASHTHELSELRHTHIKNQICILLKK